MTAEHAQCSVRFCYTFSQRADCHSQLLCSLLKLSQRSDGVVGLAPCHTPQLPKMKGNFSKVTWCCFVFAEESGGVEGQQSGRLDVLQAVASAEQESQPQEQEEFEENESEDAPQDMEVEDTISHDSREVGKAPQGFLEVGQTPGH